MGTLFSIELNERVYTLKAADSEEAKKWVDVLNQLKVNDSPTHPPIVHSSSFELPSSLLPNPSTHLPTHILIQVGGSDVMPTSAGNTVRSSVEIEGSAGETEWKVGGWVGGWSFIHPFIDFIHSFMHTEQQKKGLCCGIC